MTPIESTLKPYRDAVRRRYLVVAATAIILAIVAAIVTYRVTGIAPYAMASTFLVFAIWLFVRHELKFEERLIMPDDWYATVAKTKGVQKQTLEDLKELIGNTTPLTLDDVDRIARRDSEDCKIVENKTRPGVKMLLAKR